QNCAFWGPQYGPELEVPAGVGKPWIHQYAGGSVGPEPHFFAGVANFTPRGKPVQGPDINSVLVPFETLQGLAGVEGGSNGLDQNLPNGDGDMPLDPEKDQDAFNQMLATALGLGGPG